MKTAREWFSSKISFIELAVIVAIAISCSAFLYSDAYASCCRDNDTINYLLMPAILVAMVIGNGVHNAGHGSVTLGIIVQFVVLWLLVRVSVARAIKMVEPR